MTIPNRPLGHVMQIVEDSGLTVTYAYDDLVFVEHNAFLFRMESTPEKVSLFTNEDLDEECGPPLIQKLINNGKRMGLIISEKGSFTIEDVGNNQISVYFSE